MDREALLDKKKVLTQQRETLKMQIAACDGYIQCLDELLTAAEEDEAPAAPVAASTPTAKKR